MSLTDEMEASIMRSAVIRDALYRPALAQFRAGMSVDEFIRRQEARLMGVSYTDYARRVACGQPAGIVRNGVWEELSNA